MINFFQILNQICDSTNSAQYLQLSRRIEKAKQMSFNGYSLWGELSSDTAIGVIQSQSERNKYYYSFIRADGSFGCFDNDIKPCLGQPLYLSNNRRRHNDNDDSHFNDFEIQRGFHHANTEYKPRWEYAQPCKHIFSLLNGFCVRADSSIQDLLQTWITISLKDQIRPVRDSNYGLYIQSRFDPIKGSVLERTVFIPLLNNRYEGNSVYSFYKPSKNVKILDPDKETSVEQVLELHLEISEKEVTSLPLKNHICISCLRREHEADKLQSWLKCKHCQSLICEFCYKSLQNIPGNTPCPSVFNGYKQHGLEAVSINETSQIKKLYSKINPNPIHSENLLFKFGDE